jgi:acetylornithine deacetylase
MPERNQNPMPDLGSQPTKEDQGLAAAVAAAQEKVVPLLQQLLAFETEQGDHDEPPKDDLALQEFVAGFFRDLGAEVELFEPPVSLFADHPMGLPGSSFENRPILWATMKGSGDGRSLLFNGHYDTVPVAPLERWQHSHLGLDVEGGRVYGRGATDMKGGLAAAMAAAAALSESRIDLAGDVIFNFVPFEEASGLGTAATMLTGRRADAAICCEPTVLRAVSACRGVMQLEIDIEGRPGHAEIAQPHHSEGGAVNAVDKMIDLQLALRRLSAEWQTRPDKQHPLLRSPYILATEFHGGSYWVAWPASATAAFDVNFLPTEVDAAGRGSKVREEVEAYVRRFSENDGWLRDHQPRLRWVSEFPPPGEVSADDPFFGVVLGEFDGQDEIDGFDAWTDHVTLINEGGIPTIVLGPGDLTDAHTIDEFIEIGELRECVEIYARIATAWAG